MLDLAFRLQGDEDLGIEHAHLRPFERPPHRAGDEARRINNDSFRALRVRYCVMAWALATVPSRWPTGEGLPTKSIRSASRSEREARGWETRPTPMHAGGPI